MTTSGLPWLEPLPWSVPLDEDDQHAHYNTGPGHARLGHVRSSYVVYVLPAVVVFGLGLAITVAPLTATSMSSAPAQHSGLTSAVNNDVARFGGLLAVAVLPALAGITGTAYLHPDALAVGFRTAALISGGLCAAGGVLAALTITSPRGRPARPARPCPRNASIAASRRHH